MYQSTQQRDHVSQIAESRPKEALKIARAIEDPWFRCQALTAVAFHCTDKARKNRLLEEAFQAAILTEQPNRIVSVSSWPLKALVLSGQDDKLHREVERLLLVIAPEPSPVKRSDALNAMLGAVVSAPRPLFWRVFEPFLAACRMPLINGKRNTKGQARLAYWIPLTDRFAPARTPELLQVVGPVQRETAEARITKYAHLSPKEWAGWPNLR
ncbi:MAG: hypothetical protein V4671_09900 [Armatimonadota bacterium]